MFSYYFALFAAMTGNNSSPAAQTNYLELVRPPSIIMPASGANPVPIDNPGLWVTTNDYPAAALRENREGTVGFALTIDANGKVSGCRVVFSSGFADLDSTTCALITQRARFSPGRNARGIAQTGYYSNRVRWQIPRLGPNEPWNLPIPKTGRMSLKFVIDENGKATNCETASTPKVLEQRTPCDAGVTFQPHYNEKGERTGVTVQTSQTVNVTEENGIGLKPN